MTTAPTEINQAAIKNGAGEKHTPMMQHYPCMTFNGAWMLEFHRQVMRPLPLCSPKTLWTNDDT